LPEQINPEMVTGMRLNTGLICLFFKININTTKVNNDKRIFESKVHRLHDAIESGYNMF